MPNIPAFGALSPQMEHEYQTFMAFDPSVRQWRNAFSNVYGEQPRTEGGNYDYRTAYAAGVRPQAVPGDTIPHWSSVGKSADHPTMWKQQFMMQFGVDPDTLAGNQFTPQMSNMVSGSVPSYAQTMTQSPIAALMGWR